ncbi:MAG: transcriptional regulator [Proteobacteria bacterium]|nr:MAG: transcriptional regulator [Pseudomonadota bacterium]
MPIYEYVCKSCGHEKDVLQKMSDEPLKVCPECNEAAFTKKISAAGFRLKGAGWYETDFKTGSKKNLVGDSDSGDGKTSGSESKTSESNVSENKTSENQATKNKASKNNSSENKTSAAWQKPWCKS